jgi:putative sterol carrier protein
MSDVIDAAVAAIAAKVSGFDGIAKVTIPGEGSLVIDAGGVRAGDDEADVVLTADAETLKGIFDGDISPTAAFMQGKLSVDGNMGMAMKLAAVLG